MDRQEMDVIIIIRWKDGNFSTTTELIRKRVRAYARAVARKSMRSPTVLNSPLFHLTHSLTHSLEVNEFFFKKYWIESREQLRVLQPAAREVFSTEIFHLARKRKVGGGGRGGGSVTEQCCNEAVDTAAMNNVQKRIIIRLASTPTRSATFETGVPCAYSTSLSTLFAPRIQVQQKFAYLRLLFFPSRISH